MTNLDIQLLRIGGRKAAIRARHQVGSAEFFAYRVVHRVCQDGRGRSLVRRRVDADLYDAAIGPGPYGCTIQGEILIGERSG